MVGTLKWSKAAPLALMLALAGGPLLAPPAQAAIGIGITVAIAPPVLPVYEQPPMPAEGYIWVPGYWAYAPAGYYWVPGVWELPPQVGLLWTPPYWGFDDGIYLFHAGYWGPHVGFYGGVDYGCGYTGIGYAGGYWEGGHLFYNRTVNNFGAVHVTNVYNRTVVNNINTTRVSFNGGAGGVRARPTSAELAVMHERHIPPTSHQAQIMTAARRNPEFRSTAIAAHGNAVAAERANAIRAAAPAHVAPSRPMSVATPHPTAPVAHEPGGRFAPPARSTPTAAPRPTVSHPPIATSGRYAAPHPGASHGMPAVAPHPAQSYRPASAPPHFSHPVAPASHAPAHFQPQARPAVHPAAAAPHAAPHPSAPHPSQGKAQRPG